MRRLLPLVLLASGCAGSSREAMLIERFFAAARLNDTSALSDVSRISFNPREGTVQRFAVTDVHQTSSGTEDVSVDAQVRTPQGVVQSRKMVLTLERSSDGRLTIVGLH